MVENINNLDPFEIVETVKADKSSRVVLEGRIDHQLPDGNTKTGNLQIEFQNSCVSVTEKTFDQYLQSFFEIEINPEDLVQVIHKDISEVLGLDADSLDLYVQIQYKSSHTSKTVTKGQLA